jgi:cobalt-zinc-cadmium efflux system membrane fusion protein
MKLYCMKYICLLSSLLLLFITACKHHEEEKTSEKYCLTDSLLSKCTIDTVREEGAINELNLSGRITFNEDNVVKVVALASGHVQDVKVSLGDFVNEGQVLAIVKSSDMAGYYNDYVSAKSDLAVAKKNLDAAEGFFKSGLNTEKDLIIAQKEYEKAQSSFNRINEIIKVYGGTGTPNESSPAAYVLKSPISGFIVEKNIVTGMEIRPDDNTSLFMISGLKDVWAIANLYETDIAKVKPDYGAEITTLSYKDRIFSGKVDKISSVLDPETKALNLRIHLDNPDYALKPGMFARISLHYSDSTRTLSVPKNSIVFDDNKNFVVKFGSKCDVEMHQINVLKTFGERAFIESVVTDPNEKLDAGDKVITRNSLFVFTALKKL